MKTLAKNILSVWLVFALFACYAIAAHAADPVKSDYQAKLEFIEGQTEAAHSREAGLATACGTMADKIMGAAARCTSDLCVVFLAREVGALKCGARESGGSGASVDVARVPDPPAPNPTVGERIVGLFAGTVGKIFDTAVALGPSYLNFRLGTVQSNNSTTLGLRQSDNALGATVSTNGTFAAFGGNLRDLGGSGLAAASALGTRPTSVTTITGNGNATNGSTVTTTTTTNTNNCPAGSGGDGSGAASGNAGTGPTGGASGQGGTGTAGVGGTANCKAGK